MDRSRLHWAAGVLLSEAADAQSITPEAISFLLHACVEHGVADARERVEAGLTSALDAVDTEREPCRRIAWLELLAEAAALTDDPRLFECVQRSLPAAIDDLESLMRHSYEPGEGLLDQGCGRHLRCANALISAFQLSGRLPYGMLAEELFQSSRRWWQRDRGCFVADLAHDTPDAAFHLNCLGAEALCRLSALHADPEYQSAAVVAPRAAYADDASVLLSALARQADAHPAHAATFGRALLAWFALERDLQ